MPPPSCIVRRWASSWPRNTRRETSERYSSFFRKSESNRAIIELPLADDRVCDWLIVAVLDQAATAGVSTVLRMSSMMSSAWMFSAWPSKLRIRRCRSAGRAQALQVFAGDVVAVVEDGADLGGQDQRLGAARARPVADEPPGHVAGQRVFGVSGQDQGDGVPPQLVGDRDLPGQSRQLDDPLAVEDRLALGSTGLGGPVEDRLQLAGRSGT